jgi:hypothetical protein
MTPLPTDETFNWVKERHACSLLVVFKSLEHGVREDVMTIESLTDPREDIHFEVTSSSKQFSAMRIDDAIRGISKSVDFRLSDDVITVHFTGSKGGEQLLFTAGVTLDNEGQCKLRIGDESLEQWQVRRMALEKLFFGPRERWTPA